MYKVKSQPYHFKRKAVRSIKLLRQRLQRDRLNRQFEHAKVLK